MSLKSIESKIIDWAEDRGIFEKGNPQAQFSKMLEEVSELCTAINANDKREIEDAIGDVYVTLVIMARMQNTNIPYCADLAYDVINSRSGKMIDGVFVKD